MADLQDNSTQATNAIDCDHDWSHCLGMDIPAEGGQFLTGAFMECSLCGERGRQIADPASPGELVWVDMPKKGIQAPRHELTYEQACAAARTRPAYRDALEILKMERERHKELQHLHRSHDEMHLAIQRERRQELAQLALQLDAIEKSDLRAWSVAIDDDTARSPGSEGEVRG